MKNTDFLHGIKLHRNKPCDSHVQLWQLLWMMLIFSRSLTRPWNVELLLVVSCAASVTMAILSWKKGSSSIKCMKGNPDYVDGLDSTIPCVSTTPMLVIVLIGFIKDGCQVTLLPLGHIISCLSWHHVLAFYHKTPTAEASLPSGLSICLVVNYLPWQHRWSLSHEAAHMALASTHFRAVHDIPMLLVE